MTIEIEFVSAPQLDNVAEEIVAVYRAAFSLPPYNEDEMDVASFAVRLRQHAQYEAFRCCIARDMEHGQIVGFAYGYTSQSDQWWHQAVAAKLEPEARARWLEDAFEFVELAVLPEAWGRGIGGRLHDALLDGLSQRTAVLSTIQQETAALKLYCKRGWVPLLESFVFSSGADPYLIMGLELA